MPAPPTTCTAFARPRLPARPPSRRGSLAVDRQRHPSHDRLLGVIPGVGAPMSQDQATQAVTNASGSNVVRTRLMIFSDGGSTAPSNGSAHAQAPARTSP
jgi:hypothetical protein